MDEWSHQGIYPSGRIKKPSYSLVANWVKDSWDAIDPNMIKRSFKCCGISNNINGLEDDLIFDLSKLENVNNEIEESKKRMKIILPMEKKVNQKNQKMIIMNEMKNVT